jgi:RND superfamily putative drug exporter
MAVFLGRLARACARHPWRTIGVWVLVALALVVLGSSVGGRYDDNFRLPGSEAQRALDVLQRSFPTESGSSAYLVFHSPAGFDDAATQNDVRGVLARAADLDHVVAVTDPFEQGSISADRTVARAEVRYDERTSDLGRSDYAALRDATRTATGRGVDVEIGGPIATWEQRDGSTEWLGILAAMVVLTLVFGSLLAMLLPIAIALVAVASGQLLLTVFAGVFDVSSSTPQLVLMISLGVALDYSLFIVSRHLDAIRGGAGAVDAAGEAAGTAGVAVLFAGCTVMIAISALALSGVWAIGVMGIAVAVAVAAAVVAALTLLPAFLGLLGSHATHSRIAFLRRRVSHENRSARIWANTIVRHPMVAMLAALGILVLLASPVLALRLGQTDAGTQPPNTSQRRAFDLLAKGFGPGFNGPLLLVAESPRSIDPARLEDLAGVVRRTPDVAAVSAPRPNARGNVAVLEVFPTSSPHAQATSDLVTQLRNVTIPNAELPDIKVLVTGQTAGAIDLATQMQNRLPGVIAAVVFLSFVLLMVGFRSIVVPLKAAAMNILSIGVGYGVMVAVFQWGWAKGLIGLPETVPIVSWVPLLMFAILFGLSMDYEVFLISAIRNEHARTGDNRQAVVDGLSSTARIITAAAAIMLTVFGAFVFFPDPVVKMVGLGLAVSILVDATVVRMVLVPSTMVLLGEANWWLPRWLDRTLPSVDFERTVSVPVPPPATVTIGSVGHDDADREPLTVS